MSRSYSNKAKPGRGIYPTYFFKQEDHDPILDYVRAKMIETGTKPSTLVDDRACSSATTRNWGLGDKQDVKVKRPSFATVASVLTAMGVDKISINEVLGKVTSKPRPKLQLVGGRRAS